MVATDEVRYYVCRMGMFGVGILISIVIAVVLLVNVKKIEQSILIFVFSVASALFTFSVTFLIIMSIKLHNILKIRTGYHTIGDE